MEEINTVTQFWTYSGTDNTVRLVKEVRGNLPDTKILLSSQQLVQYYSDEIVIPSTNFEWLANLSTYNAYHKFCIGFKRDLATMFGYDFNNIKNAPKVLKRFLDTPNNNFMETFNDIIVKTCLDYLTFGRMHNEVARGSGKTALYHANSKNIYLKVTKDLTRISSYSQIFFGINVTGLDFPVYSDSFDATGQKKIGSFMLGFEEYEPSSNFYGTPYWLPIVSSIVGNNTIETYVNSFFENNARPDFMVLITGQAMTETQKTALGTQLGALKGTGNAHKALYLNFENPDCKVIVHEISKSVDDSFRNTKKDYRDDIIAIHGVPPKILGLSAGGSGLGGGTDSIGALKTLVDFIIPPIQSRLAQMYNSFFKAEFGYNPEMFLNRANLSSDKDIAIISDLLTKAGLQTVNESRAMLNLPQVEGSQYNTLSVSESSVKNLGITQDSIDNIDPDKDNVFSSQTNESLAQ